MKPLLVEVCEDGIDVMADDGDRHFICHIRRDDDSYEVVTKLLKGLDIEYKEI